MGDFGTLRSVVARMAADSTRPEGLTGVPRVEPNSAGRSPIRGGSPRRSDGEIGRRVVAAGTRSTLVRNVAVLAMTVGLVGCISTSPMHASSSTSTSRVTQLTVPKTTSTAVTSATPLNPSDSPSFIGPSAPPALRLTTNVLPCGCRHPPSVARVSSKADLMIPARSVVEGPGHVHEGPVGVLPSGRLRLMSCCVLETGQGQRVQVPSG